MNDSRSPIDWANGIFQPLSNRSSDQSAPQLIPNKNSSSSSSPTDIYNFSWVVPNWHTMPNTHTYKLRHFGNQFALSITRDDEEDFIIHTKLNKVESEIQYIFQVNIKSSNPQKSFRSGISCLKFNKELAKSRLYLPFKQKEISNEKSYFTPENDSLTITFNIRNITYKLQAPKYVGLLNQGATCYLNSVLQSLFHIPVFRKLIYSIDCTSPINMIKRHNDKNDKDDVIDDKYDSTKKPGNNIYKKDENNAFNYCNKDGCYVYHHQNSVDNLSIDEEDRNNIILNLQNLFGMMQLGNPKIPCSTKELTNSFGWDDEVTDTQYDIQEFCRALLSKIESKIKPNFNMFSLYKSLFCGKMHSFVVCRDINYITKTKTEEFYDLSLTVQNVNNLYESFDIFTEKDPLVGEDQYDLNSTNENSNRNNGNADNEYDDDIDDDFGIDFNIDLPKFGKQDADKFTEFEKFPKILQIHLKRFEYDQKTDTFNKINTRFEYPETLNILRVLKSKKPFFPTTVSTTSTNSNIVMSPNKSNSSTTMTNFQNSFVTSSSSTSTSTSASASASFTSISSSSNSTSSSASPLLTTNSMMNNSPNSSSFQSSNVIISSITSSSYPSNVMTTSLLTSSSPTATTSPSTTTTKSTFTSPQYFNDSSSLNNNENSLINNCMPYFDRSNQKSLEINNTSNENENNHFQFNLTNLSSQSEINKNYKEMINNYVNLKNQSNNLGKYNSCNTSNTTNNNSNSFNSTEKHNSNNNNNINKVSNKNISNNINIFDQNKDFDELDYTDDKFLYELFGVLVHSGSFLSGHYYACLRPNAEKDEWFMFNDSQVEVLTKSEVFEENFGGYTISHDNVKINRIKSAYMLMYVKKSSIKEVFEPVNDSDIPQHIVDYVLQKQEEDKKLYDEYFDSEESTMKSFLVDDHVLQINALYHKTFSFKPPTLEESDYIYNDNRYNCNFNNNYNNYQIYYNNSNSNNSNNNNSKINNYLNSYYSNNNGIKRTIVLRKSYTFNQVYEAAGRSLHLNAKEFALYPVINNILYKRIRRSDTLKLSCLTPTPSIYFVRYYEYFSGNKKNGIMNMSGFGEEEEEKEDESFVFVFFYYPKLINNPIQFSYTERLCQLQSFEELVKKFKIHYNIPNDTKVTVFLVRSDKSVEKLMSNDQYLYLIKNYGNVSSFVVFQFDEVNKVNIDYNLLNDENFSNKSINTNLLVDLTTKKRKRKNSNDIDENSDIHYYFSSFKRKSSNNNNLMNLSIFLRSNEDENNIINKNPLNVEKYLSFVHNIFIVDVKDSNRNHYKLAVPSEMSFKKFKKFVSAVLDVKYDQANDCCLVYHMYQKHFIKSPDKETCLNAIFNTNPYFSSFNSFNSTNTSIFSSSSPNSSNFFDIVNQYNIHQSQSNQGQSHYPQLQQQQQTQQQQQSNLFEMNKNYFASIFGAASIKNFGFPSGESDPNNIIELLVLFIQNESSEEFMNAEIFEVEAVLSLFIPPQKCYQAFMSDSKVGDVLDEWQNRYLPANNNSSLINRSCFNINSDTGIGANPNANPDNNSNIDKTRMKLRMIEKSNFFDISPIKIYSYDTPMSDVSHCVRIEVIPEDQLSLGDSKLVPCVHLIPSMDESKYYSFLMKITPGEPVRSTKERYMKMVNLVYDTFMYAVEFTFLNLKTLDMHIFEDDEVVFDMFDDDKEKVLKIEVIDLEKRREKRDLKNKEYIKNKNVIKNNIEINNNNNQYQ